MLATGRIDDARANELIAELLFLDAEDATRPIRMHVNSAGGGLTSGLAVYDTIRHVRSPVATICLGEAGGVSALILAAGAKGQPSASPGARIRLSLGAESVEGSVGEVLVRSKELEGLLERLARALAQHTGRHFEEVEHDLHHDRALSADEARAYGIIDEVLSR